MLWEAMLLLDDDMSEAAHPCWIACSLYQYAFIERCSSMLTLSDLMRS